MSMLSLELGDRFKLNSQVTFVCLPFRSSDDRPISQANKAANLLWACERDGRFQRVFPQRIKGNAGKPADPAGLLFPLS